MALRDVNLDNLKKLKGKEREEKIKYYEKEKEMLIKKYLEFQDIVDEYNEKIYNICCEIEQINIILEEMGIPQKRI